MNGDVLGVLILAGGEGRRVGGQDKGWCLYQGKPYVEHVIEQIQNQTVALENEVKIVISANRNLQRYRELGFPVLTDKRGGQGDFQGPLAAIETAMNYGAINGIEHWISWPVDSIGALPNYLHHAAQNFVKPCQQSAGLEHGASSGVVEKIQSRLHVLQIENKTHFAHLSFSSAHVSSLNNYLSAGDRSIKGWLVANQYETFQLHGRFDLLNCNASLR